MTWPRHSAREADLASLVAHLEIERAALREQLDDATRELAAARAALERVSAGGPAPGRCAACSRLAVTLTCAGCARTSYEGTPP